MINLVMKKLFTFSILFAIANITYAQKTEELLGQWKYKDIYSKNKADSNQVKLLKNMFGEMTFNFKVENIYEATMFKKELGTWSYLESEKKINLVSDKGKPSTIEIIAYNKELLTIKLGGAAIILEKVIN